MPQVVTTHTVRLSALRKRLGELREHRVLLQAADLGFSDAYIRIGQLQEYGKGIDRNAKAALESYEAAAKAGNFFAFAYMAKLLPRSSHRRTANALWIRFFVALEADPEPRFVAASRGELLHAYILTQLRLGLEPAHKAMLHRYRKEIVGYHQQVPEHARDDALDGLGGVSRWIKLNLGPWSAR